MTLLGSKRLRALPDGPPSGRWEQVRLSAGRLAAGAMSAMRAGTAPVAGHLRDHGYTIAGLGFISAASFVHSLFTGLLVTGILILIFEWKVGD
jgi:hypothetical protein